jgi:hypothetical protein
MCLISGEHAAGAVQADLAETDSLCSLGSLDSLRSRLALDR